MARCLSTMGKALGPISGIKNLNKSTRELEIETGARCCHGRVHTQVTACHP